MFIVPKSNKGFNDFRYKYLVKKEARDTDKVYLQINENEYIYVNNYDPVRKQGSNFTLEHFDQNNLKFKIAARRIRWVEKDSIFRLSGYKKRIFNGDNEIYEDILRKDTIFDFEINDLAPVNYIAETLTYGQLDKFIYEIFQYSRTYRTDLRNIMIFKGSDIEYTVNRKSLKFGNKECQVTDLEPKILLENRIEQLKNKKTKANKI